MKAAIVLGPGQDPVYGEFDEPSAGASEVRIAVSSAALSHVVRSRASGTHYSSAGDFPFVVGVDGVGRRPDGRRVYFLLPRAPFGAMADVTVVPEAHCTTIPDELDDDTAAALAIPGFSSWGALVERAKFVAGQTVWVNGATGTSGRLAIQIAKHLGARKVIATGRDLGQLEQLSALGADVTIPLLQDLDALSSSLMEQFRQGVDVVLDYLWGASAELLLMAAARVSEDRIPLRFVQIGAASGSDITLPSAVLRSSSIELLGSGAGSVAIDRILATAKAVFAAATPGRLRIDTRRVPLSDIRSRLVAG